MSVNRLGGVFACLLVSLYSPLLLGQVGRGTITGILTDATGAVIPGVEITATNTATRVDYKTATNVVGNYMIGALPVGQYSIQFIGRGFKEVVRGGISLSAGQIARVDLRLEVGQAAETVTVTAQASMLQTESSQTAEAVQSSVFADLPMSFGGSGGRNMAAFADKMVLGVSGSSFAMSMQGTPGATNSTLIDGMTNLAGFLPGDFAEAGVSAEAIQELNVMTGSVTAENGRQSGGTMSFSLKSGGNVPHGSALYYGQNEVLNANDWNNNRLLAADPTFNLPTTKAFKRPLDRQRDWGFSGGGPIYLPKLYDGRNKSFFYFTLERFNTHTSGPGTLSKSVPQPQMWQGDMSRLLTGRQVGTDALGRQVFEGQIFDPITLRQVAGRYVADAFPGNIIPPDRISQVAKNFGKIFNEWYPPVSSALNNNLYWTTQNRKDVNEYTLKADHSLTPNHKVSGYFYAYALPWNLEDKGGIWSLKDPDLGGPLSRAMHHERHGYTWNGNYDWVVNPSMLNHLSVGANVNLYQYHNRQLGAQFADEWGIKGVGLGLPADQWTPPNIVLNTSNQVTFDPWGLGDARDESYRGVIVNENFSWQRGSHSIKMGFESNQLRYQTSASSNTGGTFYFDPRTTAIPGESFTSQVGNSFASLLLGQVNSAFLTPTLAPTFTRIYVGLFVQDGWKVNPRLTLNYGLRWSGNSPITERDDQLTNFNPLLPDPGVGGLPGATEYMGTGPGRSGRRAINPGAWKDLGPTFGFAYRVTNRVSARGGYGISFMPEGYGWIAPWVAGFRLQNSVEADGQGVYRPVFNIDNGYPGVTQPRTFDPSYADKYTGAVQYTPGANLPSYVQSWNLSVQTEVTKDLLVELAYQGNSATKLHTGASVIPNQIHPEDLSRGAVLTQLIDSPAKAAAAGLPYPYDGFSGLGAYTVLPFPQLKANVVTDYNSQVGFSTYNAGNLIVTKRMSKGLYFYAAYGFSKNIANVTNASNGGNTTGFQDTYNRTKYKSISPNDRTHVLKSAVNWNLPLGRGRALLKNSNPVLNAIVGDWTMSVILNYSSGLPLGHPNSRTSPNFWNGPAVYANFNTPAGGFKSLFDTSKFNPWNANDPGNRYFDLTAFSNALPQQLGNSPVYFPQVRGLWLWSEDANFAKRFHIYERAFLQLRMEFTNLFNRHFFSSPDLGMSNSYFGNVRTASGGRIGQFGVRLEW
jgi:hypothetical protein